MTWTALHFNGTIPADSARAATLALAAVSGSPRLVLEATGRGGVVSWKLGCEAWARGRALDALRAQIPGLITDALPSTFDGLRADQAARVRFTVATTVPDGGLAVDLTEQVVRGLLGALSRTNRAELLHVQLVLGPRRAPRARGSRSPSGRQAASNRDGQHQVRCEIRIGASTREPARSHSLIQAVVGSLRPLEARGVRLTAVGTSARAFSQVRSPLLWSNRLTTDEVTPLTGWPIATPKAPPLPGVPSPHPRLIRANMATPGRGRQLGISPADENRQIALPIPDSLRHLHVLGPTGVGKSTLLARLALQDIAEGRSVVVIDPKGDLVDDILARADGTRRDDIVVIDAADTSPVGINPLTGAPDPELAADVLLGLFHSLYADAWGPRTQDVLHAGLLTLARRGDTSIAMLPLLITNPGFRRSIVGQAAG